MMLNKKKASQFLDCSARTIERYMQRGKLPHKLISGHSYFEKDDLLSIASELQKNKETKRRTPKKKPPEIVQDIKVSKQVTTAFKLDEFGKAELGRVRSHLKDKGLYTAENKTVLFRYAIAIQMQFKYLLKLDDIAEPLNIKLYEVFSKQVTIYEKTLGLTPESMSKLKVVKPVEVDEMEELING